MKEKNIYSLGVLLSVLLMQLCNYFIDVGIIYKIIIDISLILCTPYIFKKIILKFL